MKILVLGAGVTAISYVLALYLMPLGFSTFKDLQFNIRSNQAAVLLQDLGSSIEEVVSDAGRSRAGSH